ncbi:MAG: cobyric acid synthase, partial [Bacteroidota bacterium]
MGTLRPIMMVGTGSDVGKSWITTGICRWLKNHGFDPVPFKAQNMSLNSFSTPDGLEIGRAQAVQAAASKLTPRVEMNP